MSQEFIDAIKMYVTYWERQNIPEKRKLEGLAFSILVMLDGCCGSFHGNIETLAKEDISFHDMFYKKDSE